MYTAQSKKNPEEFLYQRLEALNQQFTNTPAYAKLYSRERELYDQLEVALPDDLKFILMKYSDTLNHIITEQQEFFFTSRE